MGLFDLIKNTVEGAAQAAVNVAKVPLGVVIAPIDDGKAISEAVQGIEDGVKKIGDAGPPRKKPDGKPCNWTLGGLFRLHELEVITPDGKAHPTFAVATPAQAQAHEATKAVPHG